MIYGVGTDLAEIGRFERMLDRYGSRLLDRLLAFPERTECVQSARPAAFLARRFAAKEAFAKAARSGLRMPISLQSVWVVHDAEGAPSFAYSPAVDHWLADHQIGSIHLSISDERGYAMAFVIMEKKEN